MPSRLSNKGNGQAFVERDPYRDDWVAKITREQVLDGYTVRRGEFLFVWINKTAGVSVTSALGIDKDHYNHYTAMELREVVGARDFENMFKFCFVRNPWDKVVSEFRFRIWTYQNELTSDASFAEWVRLAYVDKDPAYHDWPKMFLPQLEWLTDEKGQVAVDFVGRFENLQSDFDRICDEIKIPRQPLRHENRSRESHSYRSYYDSDTKAIVDRVFKADIEYFGYEF
jgi:chondroitin 4-sulfotransferase 11